MNVVSLHVVRAASRWGVATEGKNEAEIRREIEARIRLAHPAQYIDTITGDVAPDEWRQRYEAARIVIQMQALGVVMELRTRGLLDDGRMCTELLEVAQGGSAIERAVDAIVERRVVG